MTKMLDPGAGGNTGTGNSTDNSTEAGDTDPCSQVAVIDKVIKIIYGLEFNSWTGPGYECGKDKIVHTLNVEWLDHNDSSLFS